MRNAIYENDTDQDSDVCTIWVQNRQPEYGANVDENKLKISQSKTSQTYKFNSGLSVSDI